MELNFKDFLVFNELSPEDLSELIALAQDIKKRSSDYRSSLSGKTLALLFKKASTRTRVSFAAGMTQLGGSALDLPTETLQWKRGETLEDTARTLSLYCDAIAIRTFDQKEVEDLAKSSAIPVINALTDAFHPCQILADLLTVYEKFNRFSGLKLAYVGDGNNVANTLAVGCTLSGMDVAIATPAGYEISREAAALASKGPGKLQMTNDPFEAAANADVIYTDVWVSMGQESDGDAKSQVFQAFQVNKKLLQAAKPSAVVMHCLPAHRGEEITAEVLEGEQSIIWDQAENRLHAQKALLVSLLKDK